MNHKEAEKIIVPTADNTTPTVENEPQKTVSEESVKVTGAEARKTTRKSRAGRERRNSKAGFKPVKTEFEEKLVK